MLTRIFVSGTAIVALLPAAARAQEIRWAAPVSGNWTDAANWLGGNVPNAPGEIAVIDTPGAYTVSINGLWWPLGVDSFRIENPDATLDLDSVHFNLTNGIVNRGLIRCIDPLGAVTIEGSTTNEPGGRISATANKAAINFMGATRNCAGAEILADNHGRLTFADTLVNDGLISAIGSAGFVKVSGPLEGSGIIALDGPVLSSSAPDGLVVESTYSVVGRGEIIGPILNHGIISATIPDRSLAVKNTSIVNTSTISSLGGEMDLSIVSVTQSENGLLQAIGSRFYLFSTCSVTGGALHSSDGGAFMPSYLTLTDVTSDAVVGVPSGTGFALTLAGSFFHNDGHIVPRSVTVTSPLTIQGEGILELRGEEITTNPGCVLTIGPGQRVQGYGDINATLVNYGIIAFDDQATSEISRDAVIYNAGVLGALNLDHSRALLQLNPLLLEQAPEGVILADAALVALYGCTIRGGSVVTTNGGLIRASETWEGPSVLEDVLISGEVYAHIGTLALRGSNLVNEGRIIVNTHGTTPLVSLLIDSDLSLGGEVELRRAESAEILTSLGVTLTLAHDGTIRGQGRIDAHIVNNGTIVADVLDKELELSGDCQIVQSEEGELIASNGLIVMREGARVGGGVFRSEGTQYIAIANGVTTLTAPFRNIGMLSVIPNGIARFDTPTVTNDGQIRVGNAARLECSQPLRVDGPGQIMLSGRGTQSHVLGTVTNPLTVGPDQTIGGIGTIGWTFVEGRIEPGLKWADRLRVLNPVTLITYRPSSTLEIEIAAIDAFDRITSGSHAIESGTLQIVLPGVYTPAPFDRFTVIDGDTASVVSGRFGSIIGPALPEPYVWKVGYTPQDVVVGVSCPSDVNADFTVDILDFLDFIDDFSTCELQPGPCGNVVDADYNGDTFVDILDFLDFIDAFASGC
ncbi:MAG: hypothetical protein IT189_08755 [Microbacteriaceae bacterium]|nr:hypothetical protein [Microbacteriaceae bacterium]